jgi:lipoprotein LprG
MGSRRREGSIINRRGLAAVAGLAALIAGCGYTGPSAATLLQRAKTTFDQTSAFHIQLTSQNAAGTGTELTAAEGDAVRPDGFTGTLTVEEAGFPLQIKVISAGGKFYVQLPFSDDFQTANPSQYGFGDPGRLLDPNTGISTLLTSAQKPSIGSSVRLNGESLQQVDATLPGNLLASLLVDADPSQPVAAVFSIDLASYQVREVDLTGPIFEASHQSTFHLVLDNYGENVSVSPPPAP